MLSQDRGRRLDILVRLFRLPIDFDFPSISTVKWRDGQECPSDDDALELSQRRASGLLSLTGDVHASNLPVAFAWFDRKHRIELILTFVNMPPVFNGA